MSVEVEHVEYAHQHLSHQFEDLEQQNECYVVGMWTFLVTEIMFFGALFLALTVYRSTYTVDFAQAHAKLLVPLGLTNTFILLTSSLSMALAVRAAQLAQRTQTVALLAITTLFAFGFLGVKAVEYTKEFSEHLFPGSSFSFQAEEQPDAHRGSSVRPAAVIGQPAVQTGADATSGSQTQNLGQDKKQLFFSLYFVMTGLHGIHVIIGIGIMSVFMGLILIRHPSVEDYMPIEMAGLYWHFVDIVWIFLFPLIYLIGK